MISIIIPIYNEQESIENTLNNLKANLTNIAVEHEIIAINDGSTDNTAEALKGVEGINVITHPYNKGYGAALKTGIKNAKHDYVLFFDGDGQHKPEYIKEFVRYMPDFDMIVGARLLGFRGPYIRTPGKKILHLLANYLAEQKIPDLNSGFRLVKKSELEKFLHFLPNSFSFSTTSTLAFTKDGLNIKYIPVETNKRAGKSSVKPKDAIKMFTLILKTLVLFSPLKIFLPVSAVLFILSLGSGIYDIFFRPMNLTDATILLFVSSMLIFFFGILAEQLAMIRREKR